MVKIFLKNMLIKYNCITYFTSFISEKSHTRCAFINPIIKTMIHAIELKDLRNPEYLQFISDALTLVEKNDPTVLKVEPQTTNLQAKYQECDALFKLPLANERTEGLTVLDGKRDKALGGISFVVKGYINHYEPEYAAAADRVYKNIRQYGKSIQNQSLQAESATITNMTKDWDASPSLTADITLLQLKAWKDYLISTNNDFITLYNQRTEDYGAEPTDNLLGKRTETNAAYYKLVEMLEARKLTDEAISYDKVFSDLNASIDQYNTLINNRRARNKKNKDDDGENPTV